jgi:uncharacterized protein
MMRRLIPYILVIAVLTFQALGVYAQNTSLEKILPDVPSTPKLVNDLGDMLTPDEELKLENKLFQYEQKTSNEIAIVTIESLQGHSIEEFAVALGRKWDIGKASKKKMGCLF